MLFVFTRIGVNHDIFIGRCSCRFTVARWVSLVEQNLLTIPEHLNSPPVF